ncbi:transmembrane amino acid transporter protein-domain-containing protein [Sporodiniella umbellata]|nr:transmembrane amino acid transporter protein-domain-containing protein [Sporodiniella umbellata]
MPDLEKQPNSSTSVNENPIYQAIHSKTSLYSNFAGEKLTKSENESLHEGKLEVEMIEVSQDVKNTHKASVKKAIFLFLKAFVGSGVLFLPRAFENGGLALSCVLMVFVAGISLFAILQLVKTQQAIGGSYGEMGGILYGKSVQYIVLAFLVLSQLGFMCSYYIFISGNILNIVNVLSKCTANVQQKYYIWIVSVPIMPLVLVRKLAKLSWAAIVADVFILFGLVSCLYFTSYELYNHGIGPDVKVINSIDFALMIGTATFAFEGIGLVLPIAEAMQEPKQFSFVVTVSMTIVCVVYILIGTISYIAYGSRIQAAVVYNFPAESALTLSVQCLYSVAIILT